MHKAGILSLSVAEPFGNIPPHSSYRNLRQLRFFARHNLLLALYALHRCPNFGRRLLSSQIAKTVRACCAVVHIVDNCERGSRFATPLSIFPMRCAELATNCRKLTTSGRKGGLRFVTPFCARMHRHFSAFAGLRGIAIALFCLWLELIFRNLSKLFHAFNGFGPSIGI